MTTETARWGGGGGAPEGEGLVDRELTRAVIGAFYAVYSALGFGFLESAYVGAMELELRLAGLAVEREAPIAVLYRGQIVSRYRADLLVERRLILEIKATEVLNPLHRRQLMNYLRATDKELGLLLHFGPAPKFHRMLYTNDRKSCRLPPP